MTPSPPATAIATPVACAGSSVTLANGRPAKSRTIATTSASRPQAGRPRTVATPAGTHGISGRKPATRATPPAAIAGVTSGTTARFTSGATTDSRPNDARTIGSVAACAASETPSPSTSQAGSRPRVRAANQPVNGVAQATSPPVATVESWKPASRISAGSAARSTNAAQPRAVPASPLRPDSRASRTTPAIAAARRTDGDGPTNAT
jgi:hypothetical protein